MNSGAHVRAACVGGGNSRGRGSPCWLRLLGKHGEEGPCAKVLQLGAKPRWWQCPGMGASAQVAQELGLERREGGSSSRLFRSPLVGSVAWGVGKSRIDLN